MESNAIGKSGDEPSPSPAHPTRRISAPFAINSASRRRSLFSRPESAGGDNKADGGAPSDAVNNNNNKSPSTGNTKIPRPASSLSNQPRFTLSDAYKMAEEEEAAAQGSPSPAPRLWRSRREPINGKLQKNASPKTGSPKTGSPGAGALEPRRRQSVGIPFGMKREDTASSMESLGTPPPRRSDVSENDVDERVRQKTLSRLGLKITSTAKELVRKTSRSSLNNDSPSRSGRSTPNGGGWLSRRLSSRKGGGGSGSASPEKGSPRLEPGPGLSRPGSFVLVEDPIAQPATAPADNRSPEKSFAWQADADFTAGDLQISDSPRVSTGRSNTRIDEIRALEAMMDKSPPGTPDLPETPQPPRNTRIDELRALEAETALQFEPRALAEAPVIQRQTPEAESQQEDKAPRNWKVSPQEPKVDEHRSREIERLSRRALATARLDAIREQAARSRSRSPVQSRSPSPELVRTPSRDPLKTLSPGQTKAAALPPPEFEPPAPVREPATAREPAPAREPVPEPERTSTKEPPKAAQDKPVDKAVDEAVVLEAPAQVPEKKVHRSADDNNAGRFRSGGEAARQRAAERAKSDVKPTVGFAGLRRGSGGESGSEKRSSVANSESDPTERIEREMQLFAPMDNYSERGSLRAPSPEDDDDDDDDDDHVAEETPRPVRVDPMTLPTPRVTGAFVETPLTIRAEKLGVSIVDMAPKTSHQERGPAATNALDIGANILEAEAVSIAKATLLRGRKTSLASRGPRNTLSARGERAGSRSSSLATHRRARSASRARTPLVNSARPPTVHDDLLQIKQANQYDDSTLDDLADMLSGQDGAAGAWTGRQIKVEPDSRNMSEAQRELEVYDRMSKSLETGLLGIRSAKQGIERLEDKVSHGTRVKVEHGIPHIAHGAGKSAACPACQTQANDDSASYVKLPLPRLWHRQPRFRFTLVGLLLFLLSFWYLAETAVCAKYCKPQVCYAGQPCVWSPDDPTWGNSIPVKLDQWLTGGHGRDYVRRVRPDVEDWVADVWDVATGTELEDVDISRLSWNQKRQHRRRLMKRKLARSRKETVAPENKAKFDAWREARLAKERAEGAAQMGYAVDQDESMARDEAVR
ncbi:hypothetical protein QBC39DRAFT_313442 [Podospora conica]|nr:hypothetical protein QBC39DRAFT_313442 [Schizothecium conicum]